MVRWIVGLVVVVVIVIVGWRYFGGTEVAQQAEQAAQQAAGQAQQAAQQAGEAAQQAGQAAQQAAEQAAAGAAKMAESLKSLAANGVDVGSRIGGAVDSVTTSLQGITDGPTAQAAKAKLEDAGKTLDEVGASVEQLPAEGRKLLASTLAATLPTIRAGIDRLAAIEGAGTELKPTLDAIYAKLEAWAKAPA